MHSFLLFAKNSFIPCISGHDLQKFQHFIYMLYFCRIIRYIVLVFSFVYKKVCHNPKITSKSTDLLFTQPGDLEYFYLIITHKFIQTCWYFHQRFYIFSASPMSVRSKIQHDCHYRQNLASFLLQLAAVRRTIIPYNAKRHVSLNPTLIFNPTDCKLYFFFFPVFCHISFQFMHFLIVCFILRMNGYIFQCFRQHSLLTLKQ